MCSSNTALPNTLFKPNRHTCCRGLEALHAACLQYKHTNYIQDCNASNVCTWKGSIISFIPKQKTVTVQPRSNSITPWSNQYQPTHPPCINQPPHQSCGWVVDLLIYIFRPLRLGRINDCLRRVLSFVIETEGQVQKGHKWQEVCMLV